MKNKNTVYWVWLSLVCGPASRTAISLLRTFDDAKEIFKAGASDLLKKTALKESDRVFSDILRHDLTEAEEIVKWCSENGVAIITPRRSRRAVLRRKTPRF